MAAAAAARETSRGADNGPPSFAFPSSDFLAAAAASVLGRCSPEAAPAPDPSAPPPLPPPPPGAVAAAGPPPPPPPTDGMLSGFDFGSSNRSSSSPPAPFCFGGMCDPAGGTTVAAPQQLRTQAAAARRGSVSAGGERDDRDRDDGRTKRRRLTPAAGAPPRLCPDDAPLSPRAVSADADQESERPVSECDDGRKPFYLALGLRLEATADDVHRAYRRLALRWHPDKNPDRRQEAELRFKELLLAYETLSDPARRRAYDRPVDPHELTALLGRLMAGKVSAREAPGCLQWVAGAIATLADRLDADRELEATQSEPAVPAAEEKKVVDPNPIKADSAEPAVTLIVLGMLLRAFPPDQLGPTPPGLEANVERLQHHPSELVYALAYTVLLDHFELEEHTMAPVQAPATPPLRSRPQVTVPPLETIEALPPAAAEEEEASC